MLLKYNILFTLLLLSTLLILFMAIYIIRIKNKQQIHYAFLSTIIFILFWSFIRLIQIYLQHAYGYNISFLEYLVYISCILLPISLLYTGIIFAKTRIKFSWKHLFLFIIPVISLFIVFTNNYHHLFIVKYSFISTEFVYGKYYIIHEIYSYLCILVGLYYLVYFSIKNSGFFSKQSILVFSGLLFPLFIVILSTQKIVAMPVYIENISFSFAIICFMLAIFKFDFLNIVPVALQKVVDHISDSFVVVDQQLNIIDYNQSFIDTFSRFLSIKRKDNLINLLNSNELIKHNTAELIKYINISVTEKKSITMEKHMTLHSFDKYFTIEITPILSNNQHIGTIILLKDITELKLSMEKVRQTEKQLFERERLASLGELIGGVAHDINSPLSSLQCHVKEIYNLSEEYEEGIDDKDVTPEDHKEIAHEIQDNLQKIEKICTRISSIVNSVRNNTRNLSGETNTLIDLRYTIEDLKILLGHELRHSHCEIVYKEDKHTMLMGDPGKLGQVLTNLITNAIQAYGGNPGTVEIEAKNGEKEVQISVGDKGPGIDPNIRDGIFKQILSTKGSKGTGLGLYISYSIITGHFGGKMWLESEPGQGTTFFIEIPKILGKKEAAS